MVSAGCVRVSLFQSSSPPASGRAKAQARRALLRSRAEDYRGDLVIPLASLASSFLHGAAKESKRATVTDLRDGLERRLSAHCVLHVPADQSARFVEEHQLTPSSVTLSPTPAAASKVNAALLPPPSAPQPSFRCCAGCSSSVATEAAACTVDSNTSSQRHRDTASVPQAPWISICQLQRMTQSHEEGTALPSSSSSGAAQTHPCASQCTAEEWMLRQHDSADVYLSAAEARAVGAVDAESDALATDKVDGGACYAAFFCLTTITASEQTGRVASLRAWDVPSAQGAASTGNTASLVPTAFTVYARRHTLRIGVPQGSAAPPAALDDDSSRVLPVPTLQDVVVDRLAAQRGVRVTRLLDTRSGAAVLPCESALALLAADVAALEAECVARLSPPRSRVTDEVPTQPLERVTETPPRSVARPPSPSRAAAMNGGAAVASALLDRLVGAYAHGADAPQYYYDGVDAYGWAEQHTLISLSEVPSDAELRLGSHGSHTGSTPRRPDVSSPLSAEASLMALLSSDNSRSRPVPAAPYDAGEFAAEAAPKENADSKDGEARGEGSASRHGTRAQGLHAAHVRHRSISPVNVEDDPRRLEAGDEKETAQLSPTQPWLPHASQPGAALASLRDSLWDMNEVFVYEDDTSDAEAADAAMETVVMADGSSGSQRREQRRGSLVWSTPAARGSAGAVALGDTGISATPLLYRTSSRLSRSPPAHHGTAQAERPTQRMLLADSDSSGDSEQSFSGEVGAEGEEANRDSGKHAATESERSSSHAEENEDAVASCPSHAECRGESTPSLQTTPPRPPPLTAASQRTGPSLSAMPSLAAAAAASLPSPHPHLPTPHRHPAARFGPPAVFATMELDERTTSMAPPPCSTPPLPSSPSRASEEELRSRLQSINPVPTQSSSTPPPHQQRTSDPPRAASSDIPESKSTKGNAHQQSRVREAIALDASDLPPSEEAVRSSGTRPTSTPSTAVARPAPRTRSPIFFSPEELDGMAREGAATTATTASDDPHRRARSASSPRGGAASDTAGGTPPPRVAPPRRRRPRPYGDGHYIAAYPLQHDDGGGGSSSTSGAGGDRDGCRGGGGCSGGVIAQGGGWDTDESAPSSARHRSGRHAATDGVVRFLPSPSLSPSSTSRLVPVAGVRGGTGVRSSAAPSAAISSTSVAMAPPGRPAPRGKRRRSPTGSASGLETWIRFSDADKSSSDGDASADTGLHMLVTQQELPVYTGQSDASSTESGADEEAESDQSTSGSM